MKKQWWIAALISIAPLALWAESESDLGDPGIPRRPVLPSQRVITLSMQGDPKTASEIAFKKLYQAANAHAGKTGKSHVGAPRVR
ncbi:MAG TPA: hypothetical protein VJ385_08350 [Fibrobacteria bacterium]|nr:hypothetical protein [Fibrobacteria bacterium]